MQFLSRVAQSPSRPVLVLYLKRGRHIDLARRLARDLKLGQIGAGDSVQWVDEGARSIEYPDIGVEHLDARSEARELVRNYGPSIPNVLLSG